MKKSVKILSVVLAVLVMASALPLSVFASIFTPVTPICTQHVGKATCLNRATCEKCGLVFGTIGPHEYDDSVDPDCNVCGEVRKITESPVIKLHVYDDDCDAFCNKCGEERDPRHSGGTATCTKKAVCELCGNEYGEVDKTNHVGETEIKDVVNPSCNEPGFSGNEYCTSCGDMIAEGKVEGPTGAHVDADDRWNFDETQHFHLCGCGTSFDEEAHFGGEATCEEGPVCEVCGFEYGAALGHSFKNDCDTTCENCDYVREVEGHSGGTATCKDKAICEKCGAEYGEYAEHKYANNCDVTCEVCSFVREVADHFGGTATCTEKAKCEECGVEYGKLLPHTYDHACDTDCNVCFGVRQVEGHSGGTATCKDKAICEKCGAEYGETADHVYDNNCDATCNACGEGRTPSDHVYDHGCDADCNECGEERNVPDHFGGTATCTERPKCEECGAEYGRTLPHTYDSITDTDCGVCGQKRELIESPSICLHRFDDENDSICDLCGEVREVEVDKNLVFKSGTLELASNITVLFRVKKSVIDDLGYKNPYVIFTFYGEESEPVYAEIKDDCYVFRFYGVAANMYNDNITAKLYATNNGILLSGEAMDYSVKTYCFNMLSNPEISSELRTLLIDLLNYGAQAQLYTGYNVENLVNADLTDEEKGTAFTGSLENVTAFEETDMNSFMWNSASLLLENAVTVRIKFTTSTLEGLTIKVVQANGAEYVFTPDQFVAAGQDGTYYIYYDQLNADQMREVLTISAWRGEERVATLSYSIESYASAKQDSTIEHLAALVKAMMKYGDSVITWKGSVQ